MKKYYKVVLKYSSDHSNLMSAYSNVYYKINDYVYAPQGTKLFVFNSLDIAKNFASSRNLAVYECLVKNPRLVKTLRNNTLPKDYWRYIADAKKHKLNINQYLTKKNAVGHKKWPIGTVWCDAVKLTKLINDDL